MTANIKNIYTLSLTLMFVGITYASIAFSHLAPSVFPMQAALFILAAGLVNMETGYLLAFLSTIGGMGAMMALESKALAPWLAAELALLWALVAWAAYWDRRLKMESLHKEIKRLDLEKELSDLSREIQSYQTRITSIQSQADLRSKLSQGVALLGRSLSPGDIQTSIQDAVRLNFPDCVTGVTWLHPGGTASLDPFEVWVQDSRNSLLIADTLQDERFKAHFEKGGFLYPYRSLALVPLSENAGGGRKGILKVQAKNPGRFTKDDLRILDLYSRLGSLAFENAGLHQQVEDLAVHDPLTGLFTRRVFDERLEQECAHASRYHTPVSVAIVDIDHFKRVNDQYGHQAGDKLLTWVASTLHQSVRDVDFVARYGGEEFVLIFPQTAKENAAAIMESVRRQIESTSLKVEGLSIQITVSTGVASYPDETTSSRQLLRAADERLYRAKDGGRNRVIFS